MEREIQKSYFEVLGLCCASEVPLIERILKPIDGVNEVSVIVPTRTVIVLHDSLLISQSQLVKVLNKARLEATVKNVDGEVNFQNKWPDKWVMTCGLLLGLSFLKYFYDPMKWLAVVAVVIGLPPLILRSIASIRNFTLNINILVLISVGGTLALQDFWEAGSIIFLFAISQWLESRASYKAMAVMSSLTNMAPRRATIAETGEQVDVDNVAMNTVLAVKAGEAIPIDGIVVDGKCEVDEKMLTGESFPVTKQLDSTVWAGTININGYISVRTTAIAEECVVARMARLVEDAQKKKSRAERLIDDCAKYYIPAVVLISAGVAIIPAALRVENEKHWIYLALVVLVSTCPCALILSTPVAIFCGLSRAATTGLLVKGGEYLEILAKVRTIAFDKTGTITRGEFSVTNFLSSLLGYDENDEFSISTLLYWVSSIESKSSHPMASALVDYAFLHSVEPKPENVEEFQNFPGEGVFGRIDGKEIYIGNRKIALRAGCQTVPNLEVYELGGKTCGFIFLGPTPVGIFSLSDSCRSGAMEAIEELKSLGIRTVMLTGDCNAAAIFTQDQLGDALDEVRAELLPEDKAKIIEDFKEKGPVVMIGDGINDAPALATADIGISMGISGSALAMETGHVILMSNNIQKIPQAVRLARRTRRKLIENVVFSIATKSAILALAFAGYPLVWAAVLTDVGTCLIVILNSMLLLRETAPKEERKSLSVSSEDQNDSQKTPLLSSSSSCEEDKRAVSVKKQSGCERGCCKASTEEKASRDVLNYSPVADPETSDEKTSENQKSSSCCKTKGCKKASTNENQKSSSCCKTKGCKKFSTNENLKPSCCQTNSCKRVSTGPGSEAVLSEIIVVE